MRKLPFIIAFVLLLSSCSITTHYLQEGATMKPSVASGSVKIYSGDISQEYDVIGSVAVDVPGDGKLAAEKLREKAGKIGANAVLMVKLTKISSVGQRTGLSGVAVFVK